MKGCLGTSVVSNFMIQRIGGLLDASILHAKTISIIKNNFASRILEFFSIKLVFCVRSLWKRYGSGGFYKLLCYETTTLDRP